MSLFSTILSKLGIGDAQADTTPAAAPSSTTADATAPTGTGAASISQVDVSAKLDALAAQKGETLNWKTSIVDLLKLLDLDSSLAARQELAKELHCPEDQLSDSAKMNLWLHKAVLQKLADNGGNVPAELL